MTRETFTKLIELQQNNSSVVHQSYKLKIDLIDFVDPWEQVITLLLKEVFTDGGCDWISWWLYEEGRNAWDNNGEVIPMDTVEDLYNFLVKEGYLKK